MAAENELKIVLKLVDEASAKLKSSLGDVGKESEKATNKVNSGFKEANASLREFRRNTLIAGIAITGIVTVTKEWARHTEATRSAFDSIRRSIGTFTSFVGSIFAPTITAIAKLLDNVAEGSKGLLDKIKEGWINLAETIQSNIQYNVAFYAALKSGATVLEAHKIATDIAAKAAKELGDEFRAAMQDNILNADESILALQRHAEEVSKIKALFLDGKMDAEKYYEMMSNGSMQVWDARQRELAQLEALIAMQATSQDRDYQANQLAIQQLNEFNALQTRFTDERILNALRVTSEETAILNAYRDNYMQSHASMRTAALNLANAVKTNLSTALSDIIMNSKSAKEAFKDMGKTLLKAIVDYIVQQGVAMAMSGVYHSMAVSQASAAGAAVAAAWAAAAALVSLATMGGNAGPAAAGIAAVSALTAGIAAGAAGMSTGRNAAAGAGAAGGGRGYIDVNILDVSASGQAFGSDSLVTRPTLFLAGENGPERAIFQPVGSSGGKGMGDTTINIYSPVVTNTDAINELAETISTRLAREMERI